MGLAAEFEFFARSQCAGRSSTYARLSRAVATERAPADQLVCVFHATLLTYVDRARADKLLAGLRAAMGRRPLAWIYLEAAGLLRGGHAPAAVTGEHRADRDTYVLGVVTPTRDAVLARVATYGESIRWLA